MDYVKIDRPIFTASLLIIFLVCIPLIVSPKVGNRAVNATFNFITSNLGVVYLWAGIACLSFLLWMSFSRFGKIKLGNKEAGPKFSTYSWFSMLFCAGVATGILYWGTIEWVYYYESPPFGIQPHSGEAIEWASTYGMPEEAAAFFTRSPAFSILSSFEGERTPKIVAKYPKEDLLMSGYLKGEKYLQNKVSVAEIPLGKGSVILLGFATQNRAQTHGTFKLLFNSLYYSSVQ